MVFISKVYTKTGDGGRTMLADGSFVPKNALRVQSYGSVDETNATVGSIRTELARDPAAAGLPEFAADIDETLARIQQELFDLGSELASPQAATEGAKFLIHDAQVEQLEQDIDRLNEPLAALKSFILPGGGPTATAAHVTRTVCRRAERDAVALAAEEGVRPQALKYLNRLSDLMFVLSRAIAAAFGYEEVLWEQSPAAKP